MKTRHLLLLITLLSVSFANAQLLKKLGKKAEKAAERTVERRVEKETSKKTDEVLDEVFESDKKESDKNTSQKNKNEISEKLEKPGSPTTESESKISTGSQFFPDGEVLFYENFVKDTKGDFPAQWETNSGGEIIMAGSEKALKLYPNGNYITKISKLQENYALEFDLITENLEYKGLAGSEFGLIFSGEKTLNKPQQGAKFGFSLWKGSEIPNQLQVQNWGKVTPKIDNKIPFKMVEKLNTTTHFAIVVNGSRLRVFIDNEKAIDLPSFLASNFGNYIQFYLKGTTAKENHIVAISKIKITEEGEDIRSKILKGGFTTQQIVFDSGSDIIKKESFEILNKIGKVLQEDPNIRINIIGHTDSDGDAVNNMTLSKSRAASVMHYFTDNMGVDKNRLMYQGRGENEPIADNTTSEGKAKNRRVEFQPIP